MGMAVANSDSPHIHFPPPVVYAVGLVVGWLLGAIVPIGRLPLTVSRFLGWTLVAGWFAVGLPAVILFFRKGTTIRPDRPSSRLTVSGPYRFTRNPMYVSLALLYAGLAVLWSLIWALSVLPLVLLFIDRRIIVPEEQYLLRRFGAEYTAYKSRVRRWI